MNIKEITFENKQELVTWLDNLLTNTAQSFEKEFNVNLKKFEDNDYRKTHPREHTIFSLILQVVNKLEFHHTHIALNTIGRRNKDIWNSYTFQNLAKSIITVAEYIRPTKDSNRPDSKVHIDRKNYILNAPSSHWSTPSFKEIFYWVVENTKIETRGKRSLALKEYELKCWWVAVQCLIRVGVKKTNAQEIVARKFFKTDIRKQYKKVDQSNWANGEGVFKIDTIYFALLSKEKDINIDNIAEELNLQSPIID